MPENPLCASLLRNVLTMAPSNATDQAVELKRTKTELYVECIKLKGR